MPSCLHDVSLDRRLAELPRCFQPVIAFDQHVAVALRVFAHEDRGFLAALQPAFHDLADLVLIQRLAPRGRHINLGDREIEGPHEHASSMDLVGVPDHPPAREIALPAAGEMGLAGFGLDKTPCNEITPADGAAR